jgi:hypothetical protein
VAKSQTSKWHGRTILSQDHIPDLEHAAALNEFEHGFPREDAEEQAYKSYKDDHHKKGAAHHLRGLRAAQASGDIDEAHKHGVAYSLHMGELGHDAMDAVPDDIKALSEGEGLKPQYKFKSHNADHFLIQAK